MKTPLLMKICSVLLVITMMITMCPLSIFAIDEEGDEEIIEPVDVYSADDLEEVLAGDDDYIRILNDFYLDRTFYIDHNVTIYTESAITLTRAPEFDGDIFIVGKNSEGNICEESVSLTLGNKDSVISDLLTINGNSENMAAEVTGTVIFVCANAKINLYEDLTITNCVKVGNDETMTGLHTLSYPARIGGAAIILAGNSYGNIYGGKYINNSVNDFTDADTDEGSASTHGGAIYNYGTLNVYGGIFSNNHAGRGGAFYNYRVLNLYSAEITGNTSSTFGGAIYVPNSTSAYTYIGEENGIGDSFVSFGGNSAEEGGGAIYVKNVATVKNTSFSDNSAGTSGGAIFAPAMELTVSNSTFDNNICATNGGAIYLSGTNSTAGKEFTATESSFRNNVSQSKGGAIYIKEASAYMENVIFEANNSPSGGAIYSTTANIDINTATINDNTTTGYGGFIYLVESSVAKMNKITATGNISNSSGGFICSNASTTTIYDSTFVGNRSTSSAGAISFNLDSVGNVYNSTFENNITGGSGGAIFIYTNGVATPTIIHSCTFLNNQAGSGGAIYASKASIAELYNITAKNNSADKGGFLYITTTNTTLSLAGISVYGNTASVGGPIIWGNLKASILKIDKTKYVDMGNSGDWDDAYWSAAIYNLVTVKEASLSIPSYIGYDGNEVIPEVISVPAEVSTVAELERAINAGHDLIRITKSFELDRTFYIKNDMNIFASSAVTLTRAADFGGDIFVVGETEDGTLLETAENDRIVLSIGNKESKESNMLVIDGNRDNMTVTVTGSVFFVRKNSQVDLYENLSVINCKKNGNSKTYNYTDTDISGYPANVGGAVAIMTSGSLMNIYGGNYKNNAVNNTADADSLSSWGGVIFNHGTVNIYSGTFENNHAGRAGFLYNYRVLNVYNATIKGSSASSMGGAIYIPASTAASTNIGTDNDLVESHVIITESSSTGNGGAIYAQKYLKIENVEFSKNTSGGNGGALYLTGTNATISNTVFKENSTTSDSSYGGAIYHKDSNTKITGATFEGNTSPSHGGAIYTTGAIDTNEKDLTIFSSSFNSNSTNANGGAIYVCGSSRIYSVKTNYSSNSATSGGAIYSTNGNVDVNTSIVRNNTASSVGGFVAVYTNSTALLNAIDAEECFANTGGLVYVKNSDLEIYNSHIKMCSARTTHGGAVYVETGSNAKFYASTFENNTADDNGGALALYNAGLYNLIHSCTFIGNSSNVLGGAAWISNGPTVDIYNITAKNNHSDKGGALYITVSGTVVNLIGATFSGNTATTGGPIIWGNTFNAVLNIDKSKYTDLDHTGAYDDAYWSAAIYNKLTVNETTGEVPKYLDYGNEPYDHMSDAVDVKTCDQLEAALKSDAKHIRIISDLIIDRTFYIDRSVTIFSTAPYVLTRSPEFTGDFFVVGETENTVSSLVDNGRIFLTLGNPLSVKEDLLTFDGNSANMKETVKGTILFITSSSIVELHDNITITNCYKTDNERTYETKYNLPRSNRIGGAGAIIHSGTLDIYGGNYRNNKIGDEDTTTADDSGRNSSIGGLIYNFSNLIIRGGTFDGNTAARGGIVYNYRTVKIYGGTFTNNHATVNGGVIYQPNTAPAQLRIGTQYNAGDFSVLFENNTSVKHGGAIYTSSLSSTLINGNVTFKNNKSTEGSGGAIAIYGQLTATGINFTGNSAYLRGGAAYLANSSDSYVTRFIKFDNCKFTSNTALLGGALNIFAGSSSLSNGAQVIVNNCNFKKNTAAKTFDSPSSAFGGAIVAERKSTLTVTDSTFTQNSAANEAGAIYIAGQSTATINGSTFSSNFIAEGGTHGGAVVVRSSKLTADNNTFSDNKAINNGGAVYISYQSAQGVNSDVKITNSIIKKNYAGGNAGAIYATKMTVENEKRILTVKDTEFNGNSAESNAGAVMLATGVDAFFKNVKFDKNSAITGDGGALFTYGAIMTFETAEFNENTSTETGGAIRIDGAATATLYDILATKNAAQTSGGFLFNDSGAVKVYDSSFKNNSANGNGGAITVYGAGTSEIYGSEFVGNKTTGNSSSSNAGALYFGSAEKNNLVHSCTFTDNSGYYGGAIYATGKAQGSFYNITATNNSAQRGGFFYETTTGTTFNIASLTVSGNTDVEGAPIIWGNSFGAVLNIDKSKYTDKDVTTALDDAYWAKAIYNKLTVNYVTLTVPAYTAYKPTEDKVVTPTEKTPVPVTDVLNLAQNSTDGYINSYYDKLEKLENNSNFLSKNTATFENINGNTVTVDTFVYPYKSAADNCNFSQGILMYQAILYKAAHPEEEVYIDVASYRMSVAAAVNINPNSRYYGYMRNLQGKEYDSNGFVRLAYLMITAAKMGIHVNVLGHIDGYPAYSSDPNLNKYFTNKLNDPCDPAYVENGVIGDYLDFNKFNWTLDNKGGTDMMHTKMCAVSHYLDWNGVEHKNAVWSSSSNLDGIRTEGWNGNYKLQTASIVTGHAEIYRTATNYLRLIGNYKEQEQVYEFHELISQMNTYQIDMINAGRGDEIPEDERIVYLGTEYDKVFELYFTPFGGDQVVWDEEHNPYCKYLRKMYNSEDYILFSWNTAEYNGEFPLGKQIEDVITSAFHDNRNPNNRFYAIMNSYNSANMSDLKVGKDIGFFSLNKRDFGYIHNKDMQMSYVENGQRYYVSLLNSCNVHSGSMCYQSNFMLVIKETDYTEKSVFFNHAENTTTGIVDHDYGEVLVKEAEENKHGYTYKTCQQCDKQIILDEVHNYSDWITDREVTSTLKGIEHKECTVCGEIFETREVAFSKETSIDTSDSEGKFFTTDTNSLISVPENVTPLTIEATIQVPKNRTSRAGVIVGNYKNSSVGEFNVEIYTNGNLRLYCVAGSKIINTIFATDLRSDNPQHIAVTIDSNIATLYLGGEAVETKKLVASLPENMADFKIGGDNREGNAQHFKCALHSIALFSDIRTPDEIKLDAMYVTNDADNLIYSEYYSKLQNSETASSSTLEGKTFTGRDLYSFGRTFAATPRTIEATILAPKSISSRMGVIVGNNNGSDPFINLEVYTEGKVRLLYNDGTTKTTHTFSEDIRSDSPVNIAVTMSGTTATLYVNGIKKETATVSEITANITKNFVVGGDNTPGNYNYFKGTIYSVNMFSDARSEAEVLNDAIFVNSKDDSLLASVYFTSKQTDKKLTAVSNLGQTFSASKLYSTEKTFDQPAKTFEAVINVPKTLNNRAGVIISNYDGSSSPQVSIEVYTQGKVRLFYHTGSAKIEYIFSKDIRSADPTHIAITIDDMTASLYVNGEFSESTTLTRAFPNITSGLMIGSDNRSGNSQYFKGTIYSAAIFSDVRTAEEIKQDSLLVTNDADALLYSEYFANENDEAFVIEPTGKTFTETLVGIVGSLSSAPKTIEADVFVPENITSNAGVIFSNRSDSTENQIGITLCEDNKVRLDFVNGEVSQSYLFSSSVTAGKLTNVAVTFSENTAALYIDGKLCEIATLDAYLPDIVQNIKIGGDNRVGNPEYFKGSIYSVNMFSDVRSDSEILSDSVAVSKYADNLIYSDYYVMKKNDGVSSSTLTPVGFNSTPSSEFEITDLNSSPYTIEATVKVPKSMEDRAGTIIGNYKSGNRTQMNLEIYDGGRVRIYYVSSAGTVDCIFSTDIRSDNAVHLAVTLKDNTASLYVNGVLAETKAVSYIYDIHAKKLKIGSDFRPNDTMYFKGTIYSVNLFSEARTAEQIASDMLLAAPVTDSLIYSTYFANVTNHSDATGRTFSKNEISEIGNLDSTPYTFEATINVPKSLSGRGGVIVGNYGSGAKSQISIEIYDGGRIRLFYVAMSKRTDCVFTTDIRSNDPVHIAVTLNGKVATLYIDGVATESITLDIDYKITTDKFTIGGDKRSNNSQYFKGTIYSVALFSDVRTAEEIKQDVNGITDGTDSLICNRYFNSEICEASATRDGHIASDWIIDSVETATLSGVKHKECIRCSKVLTVSDIKTSLYYSNHIVIADMKGKKLSNVTDAYEVKTTLPYAPVTFEVSLNLPSGFSSVNRGGVILGNYDGTSKDGINLEIYTNGHPRLYYKVGSTGYSYVFNTDIRSNKITHLAVTIDGKIATLYINGVLKETTELTVGIPKLTSGYYLGNDQRTDSAQYFKGTIYSVNMFSDIRTAEEIAIDALAVTNDTEGLVFSKSFITE